MDFLVSFEALSWIFGGITKDLFRHLCTSGTQSRVVDVIIPETDRDVMPSTVIPFVLNVSLPRHDSRYDG